jgi:xanthine dehydrogenase accessory factor
VLEAALKADVPYIALVASRKRGDIVLASLGTNRDRVRSPAGLDIGAYSASEVAVSILAEIIELRPRPLSRTATQAAPAGPPALTLLTNTPAVDPVCGMDVTITPTALSAVHAHETYYFCGSGCKVAFTDDPHRYIHHG